MKMLFQQKTIITILVMVFCFKPVFSQEREYSVAVTGLFTTTSRVYYDPYDADVIARNQYTSINDIWGIGLDVRRALNGNHFKIGLSADYVWVSEKSTDQGSNNEQVPVENGFISLPVELTGYFTIPFGFESAQIYMGGGFGAYFGERHVTYNGVSSHIISRKPGFGIHVVSGFEYILSSTLSLRSEVKFRNVQFESENVFVPDAGYTGPSLPFNLQPFTSRINIDGLLINIGIAYHF